ncbi:MAG: hypothetical protein SFZ03_03190 [Candidatus Melainabacteria bacterium]|nr:hypothetical protein [Candidatus Melainabacteria bacterium]
MLTTVPPPVGIVYAPVAAATTTSVSPQRLSRFAPLERQLGHYMDPYTAESKGIHLFKVDQPLNYNALDRLLLVFRQAGNALKRTGQGLRGDSTQTFSDFMLEGRVPYYAGGVALLSSFLLGSGKPNLHFKKMGAAVGLYYLGVGASNALVNGLYKLRYGLDLDMLYRSKDGRFERMFSSTDFPRFDLIPKPLYKLLAKRLNIPDGVADPDGAVRENLRKMIGESRLVKMVFSSLAAAVGAGFLARSDAWGEVFGRHWRDILTGPGNVLQKSGALAQITGQKLLNVLDDVFRGPLQPNAPWNKRFGLGLAVGTVVPTLLWGVLKICHTPQVKKYEPFQLDPALVNSLRPVVQPSSGVPFAVAPGRPQE